jgi:hypothetical protein
VVALVDSTSTLLSNVRLWRPVFLVAVCALAHAPGMNIRATSDFRAGDWSRFEAMIVPKLITAVTAATDAVFQESQIQVPVRSGKLKSSGSQTVEWKGQAVTGYVTYSEDYAAYVEYGIRQRGAAGKWAGPFVYSEGNGFAGFGYIRGSLDSKRPEIRAAFADAGFIAGTI